jgi:hypothetical protein
MAATFIDAQQATSAGLNPNYFAADTVNGNSFIPAAGRFLLVKNAGGGAVNLTLITPGTVDGNAIADKVVSVPNASVPIVIATVTYDGVIPDGLGERGTALWIDVLAERDLDAAGRVLLAEACRMADRLEQLDRLLRGDIATWAVISDDYGAGGKRRVTVVLDDALGEARQQAATFRQLVATLKLGTAVERQTERGSLDQLAARRADRRTAPRIESVPDF